MMGSSSNNVSMDSTCSDDEGPVDEEGFFGRPLQVTPREEPSVKRTSSFSMMSIKSGRSRKDKSGSTRHAHRSSKLPPGREHERAPILDITVVYGNEGVPAGYTKIAKTVGGRKADLNSGAGGQYMYLCEKKDLLWEKPAITALTVIYPDDGEVVPPGFSIIKRRGQPINLNQGTSGSRLHLCFKRGQGDPICSLCVILPKKKEAAPADYSVIEYSPLGKKADLNIGTGGLEVKLGYKQHNLSLQALRSHPNSLLPLELEDFSGPVALQTHSEDSGASGASGLESSRRNTPPAPTQSKHQQLTATALKPAGVGSESDTDTQSVSSSVLNQSHHRGAPVDIGGVGLAMLQLADDSDSEDPWNNQLLSSARPGRSSKVVDGIGLAVDGKTCDQMYLLLTSLSMQQGNLSQLALEQLHWLLVKTPFFDVDMAGEELEESMQQVGSGWGHTLSSSPGPMRPNSPLTIGSAPFTLLDFAIEAVCAQVSQMVRARFIPTLKFLSLAMRKRRGLFNLFTLQRVLRAYTLLAAFYASYGSDPGVVKAFDTPQLEENPGLMALHELQEQLLGCLEMDKSRTATSLAGLDGHVSLERRSAKKLPLWVTYTPVASRGPGTPQPDWSLAASASSSPLALYLGPEDDDCKLTQEEVGAFAEDLVWHIVNTSVDSVELAKNTERALETMKKYISFGSEMFWWEEVELGRALFWKRPRWCNMFVLCCTLCKMAGGTRAQADASAGGKPALSRRQIADKLIGLTLLGSMLEVAGARFCNDRVVGYTIRRLVVSTVLENTHGALMVAAVFQQQLKLISTLWRRFRRHCKLELAVLMKNFIIKMLRAPSTAVLPSWRAQILDELLRWMDVKNDLVELFLNYDMDRKFVEQWHMFQDIVGAVCSLAEGYLGDDKVQGNLPPNISGLIDQDHCRMLRVKALHSVAKLGKCLMDAAGHAHVMATDAKMRAVSLKKDGGWEESNEDSERPESPVGSKDPELEDLGAQSDPEPGLVPANRRVSPDRSSRARKSRSRDPADRPSSFRYRRELRQKAEEVVGKGMDIYKKKGLKKAVQFLVASDFLSDTPRDIANFLRLYQLDLDATSIGEFLSEPDFDNGGYWKLIRYQYVRAISFHGQSLEQALRNLLTNSGFKLPGEAQRIDRLLNAFADCYFEDNAETCPFESAETPYVLSFAIIMLNTDLHRVVAVAKGKKRPKRMTKDNFIHNLRGVTPVELDQAFLGSIYDSIEASPIKLLLPDQDESTPGDGDQTVFSTELSQACKQGEELLRAFSMFGHRFYVIGVDTSLSKDLVKQMFEASWFNIHGVVNSVLDSVYVDTASVAACLDIVKCNICTSVFLGVQQERVAFLNQLAKLKHRMEGSKVKDGSKAATDQTDPSHDLNSAKEEEWYRFIETAGPADSDAVIEKVHLIVHNLQDKVQDVGDAEELHQVARRLTNFQVLDGERRFIREGDLVKTCRSGRKVQYRFFLFSDVLVYAHGNAGGTWKVHEQLLLSLLRIDQKEEHSARKFVCRHPKKNFTVTAESVEAKQSWVRDINAAIQNCVKVRTERRGSHGTLIDADKVHNLQRRRVQSEQLSLLSSSSSGKRIRSPSILNIAAGSVLSAGVKRMTKLTSPRSRNNKAMPLDLPVGSENAVEPRRESLYSPGLGNGTILEEEETPLQHQFMIALEFWSNHMDKSLGQQEQRLALYGLFKQAHEGNCMAAVDGEKENLKDQAWRANTGMSSPDAMQAFVELLSVLQPSWLELMEAQTPQP